MRGDFTIQAETLGPMVIVVVKHEDGQWASAESDGRDLASICNAVAQAYKELERRLEKVA